MKETTWINRRCERIVSYSAFFLIIILLVEFWQYQQKDCQKIKQRSY